MEVTTYSMTNPVIIGTGARKLIGEKTKELGCTKVLFVTDVGLIKAEVEKEPIENLKAAGIEVVVYDKINPDPLDSVCVEGMEVAKKEKVDGIVALGGGSVIDAAKAINVLINNPLPLEKYYGSWDYKPGLPLIMIPTTAGTGSESTIYGVITDKTTNMKKVVLLTGTLAICDPSLTYALPKDLTASTGLDSFAHCAEAVTCNINNPFTEALAMNGIKRVVDWLPVAYRDPQNIEAREQMMIAANFGGIAFSATCCHLGHAIAQQMGASFHTPHGITCAWALPEVMAYSAIGKPDKVKVVANYLGCRYDENDPPNVLGQKVAENIRQFMRKLNVKSIKDYGIARQDLVNIVDLVMADNCFPFIPSPLTRDEVKVILGRVYDTYQ
jgi:alcohol dehydrogenase class IV